MKTKPIFLFIALLLAALACNLPMQSDNYNETSDPPLENEHTPGTGDPPTPSALPTQTDNPIPHLTPGNEVIITKIDMFTSTQGWAIGGEQDPGDHILYTLDGGNTWHDRTPPEENPAPVEGGKVAYAFFLDESTAWVTYAYADTMLKPDPPLVWRTTDGGETWIPSVPLAGVGLVDHFTPTTLTFSDSIHGWLLISVGAGMSHDYSLFYHTTDGGNSWLLIHDPINSNDLQGCCKTGLVFRDSLVGLLAAEQGPYGAPYTLWTGDGGSTWTHRELTPPVSDPGLFDNASCSVHSPSFTAPGGASTVVALNCNDYSDGVPEANHYLYTSMDEGLSWVAIDYPGGDLLFLDTLNGFAFDKNVYITTNGGGSWSLVSMVSWEGDFDFISSTVGWAVARNGDEIALVKTTNGGSSWMIVETSIVP